MKELAIMFSHPYKNMCWFDCKD